MDPGPTNDSVLQGQTRHRSSLVWDGQVARELRARRRDAVLHRTIPIDPRIVPHLVRSGFYGFARIGHISLDWHLITALVERWRPETHTFHLAVGECTITLQDVGVQFGLPVDGRPVTGTIDLQWWQVCEQLLGFRPAENELSGCRIRLRSLAQRFMELSVEADEVTIAQYARAYIMQLIGGSLFSDKSNNLVNLMFLPLLEDFDVAGQYSWGSACLAWLYRELCRASDKDAHQISGLLLLLQLWAWDHFPFIAPRRGKVADILPVGPDAPLPPLGIRWRDTLCTTEVSTHVLIEIREALDMQTIEQVIWCPYSDEIMASLPQYCLNGTHIWHSIVPLICFHIVEWHRPDRVLRQFGLRQTIPDPCDNEETLHKINLKGRVGINWHDHHARYIEYWDQRVENVVLSEESSEPMRYYDDYMVWYRSITRRYIGRRGAIFQYMIDYLNEVDRLSGTAADLSLNHSQVQSMTRDVLRCLTQERHAPSYHYHVHEAGPSSPPHVFDPFNRFALSQAVGEGPSMDDDEEDMDIHVDAQAVHIDEPVVCRGRERGHRGRQRGRGRAHLEDRVDIIPSVVEKHGEATDIIGDHSQITQFPQEPTLRTYRRSQRTRRRPRCST